jgi:hypothetical protein
MLSELSNLYKGREDVFTRSGSGEVCIMRFLKMSSGAFTLVLLREPRAITLSEYNMCAKSPWAAKQRRLYNLTYFPPDFESWVDHFASPAWEPHDHGNDFRCYSPQNLQTRQLASSCLRKPHRFVVGHNWPVTQEALVSAAENLAQFDFVGVTEWMPLSMCLLRHKLGADMPDWCFDDAAPVSLRHARHNVPLPPDNSTIPEKTWLKVDEMTAFDRRLYALAVAALLHEFREFQSTSVRPLARALLLSVGKQKNLEAHDVGLAF